MIERLLFLSLCIFTLQVRASGLERFQAEFLKRMQEQASSPSEVPFLFKSSQLSSPIAFDSFASYKQTCDHTPLEVLQWPSKTSEEFAPRAQQRLTLLIFPGIIGEFILNKPFSDVADAHKQADSPLLSRWRELQANSNIEFSHPSLTHSGATEQLVQIKSPIRDFFTIFSVPAHATMPAFDVIVFNSPAYSLETFGDLTEVGARYSERLDRLFDALDYHPERIALLGYSLGVIPAMDFINASQDKNWSSAIEAVVSLSGILYGSAVADAALGHKPTTPNIYQEAISALDQLRVGLQTVDSMHSLGEKLKILYANQRLWFRTISEFYRIWQKNDQELGSIQAKLPQLQTTLDQGKLFWGAYANIDLLTSHFKLLTAYNQNIRRWKILLWNAKTVVEQLSSQGRQQWFLTHPPLPKNIRLTSLTAVMPSGLEQAGDELWRKAYETSLPDFQIIHENLLLHQKMIKLKNLDGWVAIGESRYDPRLTCKIAQSWCQAEFKAEWWGMLNTDHWGIAIAHALPQKKIIPQPFPRGVLLEAIARTLSAAQ